MLELERAYITDFLPGFSKGKVRNYGYAAVLDSDNNPTGEEVFVHLNNAQFPAIHFREVVWNGKTSRDGVQLKRPIPSKGTEIVFERQATGRRLAKAKPWCLADLYDRCIFDVSAWEVRLVTHDLVVVWKGFYNATQTRITPVQASSGTLPSELSPGHEVHLRHIKWLHNQPLPTSDWLYWGDGFHLLTRSTEEFAMK